MSYARFPSGNAGTPVRAFDGKASVMTQNRQVKEEEINRLHSKTFSAWCNVHLRKKGLRVNDVTSDFADGLLLIQLVEVLSNQSCPLKYNKAPRMVIQQVENVSVALQFINRFTKVNVNPQDVVSGNAKVILSILWRLIVTFQMSQQNQSNNASSSAVAMKREAKKHLLNWVSAKTGAQVFDCDRSFDDGALFCLLVHAYDNSLLDVNRVTQDARNNLEMAFQLIEQHLQIPRMLAVEDMTNPDISARPDEQCIMTYLSQFPEAFLKRPTPQAVPVTEIEMPDFPSVSNVPSYNQGSFDQASYNQGSFNQSSFSKGSFNQEMEKSSASPSTDSLSSHPSISNMSESGSHLSQSSFPQPPNSYESTPPQSKPQSHSRFVVGSDLPLPPTVAASSLETQQNPASNVNTPPQSNYSSYSQNPSQPMPSYAHSPSASFSESMPQTPPQRPPPPSSGFGDFFSNSGSSFGSQTPPQRPPPPSNAFGDFGFNQPPAQNSFNPSTPPTTSTQQVNDWHEKELELKRREEEFRRQQEEFARQKEAHEREMERLRQEAAASATPSPDVSHLQKELSYLRENTVYKLKVEAIAARNLMPGTITGKRDPYAVIIINNYKEQTTVVKRSIHPTWNAEFSFFIEDINWSINLTIYDKNTLKHDDFLGKVVIPIKQLKEGVRREEWLTLQPKKAGANISGEVRIGLLLSR